MTIKNNFFIWYVINIPLYLQNLYMGKEIGCIACGHLISTEGFSPSRIEIKCRFCHTVNTLPKKQVLIKEYVRYTGIRLNAIHEQDKLR